MGHEQAGQPPAHSPTLHGVAIPLGEPAPAGASFADVRVGMNVAIVDDTTDLVAAHCATSPCAGARLTGLAWNTMAPRPDGPLSVESTITRWRREGSTGLLHSETYLRDENERELELARATWTISSTDAPSSPARVAWDIASGPWTERIAARLANPEFASATEAFDGSIGLAAGDVQTFFRIYRGNVIEAGRKPLDGPTFTVHATESTWIGMLAARRSDYVRRAGQGQFSSSGSSFQYLRMFKAIMLILEAARTEVREAADA